MDIIDNAPQLKQCEMIYPSRVKIGHYGVRVVDNIITQLSAQGYPAEFSLVKGLDPDMATFYKQFEILRQYDLGTHSHWTRSSVNLSAHKLHLIT